MSTLQVEFVLKLLIEVCWSQFDFQISTSALVALVRMEVNVLMASMLLPVHVQLDMKEPSVKSVQYEYFVPDKMLIM